MKKFLKTFISITCISMMMSTCIITSFAAREETPIPSVTENETIQEEISNNIDEEVNTSKTKKEKEAELNNKKEEVKKEEAKKTETKETESNNKKDQATKNKNVYNGPVKLSELEDGEITFINTKATNYNISFADQGKVEWKGIESGTKDFTFSLIPNETLKKKYDGVEFISFDGEPEFSTEADISLAIIVDNTDPALYVVNEDNSILRIADVEIVQEKDTAFFKFKDTKLAKSYMLSPVVIPGIKDLTKSPVVVEPEQNTETVEELPTEETTQEATDAPKTGINDTLPIVCLLIGLAGMAAVLFIKRK